MILERIAKETGVSVEDLRAIVTTAKYRYRTYTIPKRTGGRREISHPTPEVKFLQRWMIRNLFSQLPIHHAARAYRQGVGIADNAKLHADQNYLMKIDFENFFPSITSDDIRSLMRANSSLIEPRILAEDMEIIVMTVCKDGALTIGAPSSPILSNSILYDFDCFAFEICREQNAIYSRYADDLFISTNEPNILSGLFESIKADLEKRPFPTLKINKRKTVFTSKKRKRVVTGLVLTSDHKLSIGRKKKRQIRTLVYLYSRGELAPENISYLRGFLAFVSSVEPRFIARLKLKYGDTLLNQLMREDIVTRKPDRGIIDLY